MATAGERESALYNSSILSFVHNHAYQKSLFVIYMDNMIIHIKFQTIKQYLGLAVLARNLQVIEHTTKKVERNSTGSTQHNSLVPVIQSVVR